MDDLAENLILFLETKEASYFEKFYHNLYPLAFKVSILITKNAADADDVAQTAFYTVFNQLETCLSLKEKNSTKVKSWFLSIVYNQSKLVVRSRVRNKKKELNQEINKSPTESKNQMSAYLESQMKSAINSLDEKYRTPIILKYNEGLNSNEIADILQVNEATLRVRIRRGLAKVKDLLASDQNEFEKLLPSISLILFENYSTVPEIPKFINKDVINAKLLVKQTSFSMVKLASLSTSIFLAFSYLVYLNFYQPKLITNPTNVTKLITINETKLITPNEPFQGKMEWDFTKGNQANFKVLLGNWDYVNDGMVTTGMKEPDATLVIIPIKPAKYFKLNFFGKLEFDKSTTKVPYVTKGILINGQNILSLETLVDKFLNISIDPRSQKKEFGFSVSPLNSTIYFTQHYIGSSYLAQKLINRIDKRNSNEAFDSAGVLIRDFKIQKITYEPLTENEMQKIELEIENIIKEK